jgi:dihydropteroate synthase
VPDRSTDQRSPADRRGFAALAGEAGSRLRLQPSGFLHGRLAEVAIRNGSARPLTGGRVAFTHVQVLEPAQPPVLIALADFEAAFERRPENYKDALNTLKTISAPRPPWAGFSLDRTRIMGVVNATPDSFSDGGRFLDPAHAIEHGRALLEAGADIIDVGGESTRPGADPVRIEEELHRVLPVVRALAEIGAPVSIDTRHAPVMMAALAAGARVVNDVTALNGDPDSLAVVARSGAAVVLMHLQGEPATMQRDPRYGNVVLDICDFLESRITACERAGIDRSRLVVDPGIGFGKTLTHNLELLAHLGALHGLGVGILLGVSRKGFIAKASHGETPDRRIGGSLAATLAAHEQGIQWLRVHDVAETRQAIAVKDQIDSAY